MSIAVAVTSRAPLDYSYALDAAVTALPSNVPPLVLCNIVELRAEVEQRTVLRPAVRPARAALWVEPLAGTWQSDLLALSGSLPAGAVLAIVASRPLARLVPERRGWPAAGLGLEPGGLSRLQRAARRAGFRIGAVYGVHTFLAVALNAASAAAGRWGRLDLADRLHFAGRLRYCVGGPWAGLATVALLVCTKERAT